MSDRLIFVDELDQQSFATKSINIVGNEPIKELVPAANYLQTNPSWSPNGERIA